MKANRFCQYTHRNPSRVNFYEKGGRIAVDDNSRRVLQSAVKTYGTLDEISVANQRSFPTKHMERFSWMVRNIGYDVVVK